MRLLILLTLMLLFALPAAAQEGYSLPESPPIITPENAAEIQELAIVDEQHADQFLSSDHLDQAISPDGQLKGSFIGGCGAINFKINDAVTDELLAHWAAYSVCGSATGTFSQDGKWLILGFETILRFTDVDAIIEVAASDENRYTEGGEVNIDFGFIFTPNDQFISRITLSSDGSFLAVSFETNPAFIDVKERTTRVDIFSYDDLIAAGETSRHPKTPESLLSIPGAYTAVFSPDSAWLMTDIGLWNIEAGEQVAEIFSTTAAFSPDNNMLATVDAESVHLWSIADLATGTTAPLITIPAEDVKEIAFSPEGTLLYLKQAGEVSVWGIGD